MSSTFSAKAGSLDRLKVRMRCGCTRCTAQIRCEPSVWSTRTIGSSQVSEKAPTSCFLTPAGLESGPSRLKIVRVPSSVRTGATWRIEA